MGKINYEEEHINGIIDKYDICVTRLTEIEQLLSSGTQSILSRVSLYYEGHGKEPAEEALRKTAEHILMLKECCFQTKEYVIHSLETLKAADNA